MPIDELILQKLTDIEQLIKPKTPEVTVKISEHVAQNTAESYQRSLRRFAQFLEVQEVTIKDFTAEKLQKFFEHIKYTVSEDCAKAYCIDLRAIYNYSTRFEDNAPNPFKRLPTLRRRLRRRSRALTPQELRRMYYATDLPKKALFARDAFMLSFCLCGMNICDIYALNKPKDGILHYYRQKTKNRREDNAEQYLQITPTAARFAAPYILKDGDKWLYWSKLRGQKNTVKYINDGLKILAELLELPHDLTTYYARHTFATIARNNLHIDIFDIAECLNHTPPSNTIDFVYIKPDPMKPSRIAAAVVDYVLADGCAAAAV
ncbi:MAG: phage integrase SAM-like domain-containing protein [Bacteroidales bacterium]|nr:phage integrase SAM-like domain-containing protein [Bacteroidales bacterium]